MIELALSIIAAALGGLFIAFRVTALERRLAKIEALLRENFGVRL